jgi:hypothetical protein
VHLSIASTRVGGPPSRRSEVGGSPIALAQIGGPPTQRTNNLPLSRDFIPGDPRRYPTSHSLLTFSYEMGGINSGMCRENA